MENSTNSDDFILKDIDAKAELVFKCCDKLELPANTMAYSLMIFNRFCHNYGLKNIQEIDEGILICSVVFISIKLTEQSREIRDVVNVYEKFKYDSYVKSVECYLAIKDRLIKFEQVILRYINFDVNVDIPHIYYYNYTR